MITSTKNPRVKAAQRLHRKRHRQQTGTILLEGVRLLQDALATGARPQTVFYAPELVETNPGALTLLQILDDQGIELVACTSLVFSAFTETVTPQGIAAIFHLPVLPLPTDSTFTLILDQVRDPGNSGTLLRSAEAAGADAVLATPHTADPFHDKVLRAGMGVHFRLPLRTCDAWTEVVSFLRPEQTLYMAEANAALAYDAVDWQHPFALVVGGEADGASAEACAAAIPIAIPMHGATESLNAAIAGSVIMFEAARQRRKSTTTDFDASR